MTVARSRKFATMATGAHSYRYQSMNEQPAVTARAGANIALVKYWGKRDPVLNLPAAGSISITLQKLTTTTRVSPDPALHADQFLLDGHPADARRVARFLDLLREVAGGGPYCRVDSSNDFPTGAGLASSASAFAALALAGSRALGLSLSPARLSELARRGSGSAARSIFGGFVEWAAGQADDGSDSVAAPLLAAAAWPLEVIVAVTDSSAKAVSSTDGMNRTMQTSPCYPAWVESVQADLSQARRAIAERDFQSLAEVAERSALTMHASAMAARPGIVYWLPATLAALREVRALRASGEAVFFTIDAGPQLKAVCLPDSADKVAAALAELPGVRGILRSGLGPGAGLV